MPPKGKGADKGAKKAVLPPFYAFGKLNKNGQISDKKGAARGFSSFCASNFAV